MRSARQLIYSTWGRVLIPLIFVGISGISINMISAVIAESQIGVIKPVFSTRWTLMFIASAACLTWYELKRIPHDLNRQEYVNTIMNDLTPDIVASCKNMIKEGKVDEAMTNISTTSKLLKPPKSASR